MTLIDHIDSDNNIELPVFICHYTSLENFIKILDTKTFYLFNSYQMNDYKENVRVIEILERVISQKKSLIPDDYLEKLKEILSNEFYTSFIYICCFTELRDSLSQWRAYGDDGNGICLIFNPKDLGITYSLLSSNSEMRKFLSFHNVIYSEEQQEKLVEEIIKISLKSTNLFENGKAYTFADKIIKYISMFAPIFKINEFQEEKEWRIIYGTKISYTNTSTFYTSDYRNDIGFIQTRNNLKSFFPLKLDEVKFRQSLKSIILGPKTIIPDMEILTLLKTKGFHNTQVFRSKISYR